MKAAIAFTLFVALSIAYEAVSGTFHDALKSRVHKDSMNNMFLLSALIQFNVATIGMCFWDNFFGEEGTYAACRLYFWESILGLWKD